MNAGDKVRVRSGNQTLAGEIVLISQNQHSISVALGDTGFSRPHMMIHKEFGIVVMASLDSDGSYVDIFTGDRYSIERMDEPR